MSGCSTVILNGTSSPASCSPLSKTPCRYKRRSTSRRITLMSARRVTSRLPAMLQQTRITSWICLASRVPLTRYLKGKSTTAITNLPPRSRPIHIPHTLKITNLTPLELDSPPAESSPSRSAVSPASSASPSSAGTVWRRTPAGSRPPSAPREEESSRLTTTRRLPGPGKRLLLFQEEAQGQRHSVCPFSNISDSWKEHTSCDIHLAFFLF